MLEHEPLPEYVELTAKQVVDAAVKVHRALGPGRCMKRALRMS